MSLWEHLKYDIIKVIVSQVQIFKMYDLNENWKKVLVYNRRISTSYMYD